MAGIRVRRLSPARMACLLVLLTVATAACGGNGNGGGGGSPESGLDPVSVRMDVFFYGAHIPLLAGIGEGIYQEHGLDVTAETGTGSGTTIQLVANGSADFGFADGGVLVQSAGQGVDATMVVGMLERSPMAIMSRQDAGIDAPTDLNGRVGGFSAESAPEIVFPAFASANGVDADSIQRRQVDIPTRDSLFVQGETEFTFGYTATQLPLLEERCECTLSVLRYADHGVNAMSNGIVVSQSFAEENRDVVERFAAATVEAIEFSVDSPDEAVAHFFEYASDTQLSESVVRQQWEEATQLLHTDATAGQPYGCMAASDWQQTIELFEQHGGVSVGEVQPDDVFENSFLPAECG